MEASFTLEGILDVDSIFKTKNKWLHRIELALKVLRGKADIVNVTTTISKNDKEE
jgi:hypothetical protein